MNWLWRTYRVSNKVWRLRRVSSTVPRTLGIRIWNPTSGNHQKSFHRCPRKTADGRDRQNETGWWSYSLYYPPKYISSRRQRFNRTLRRRTKRLHYTTMRLHSILTRSLRTSQQNENDKIRHSGPAKFITAQTAGCKCGLAAETVGQPKSCLLYDIYEIFVDISPVDGPSQRYGCTGCTKTSRTASPMLLTHGKSPRWA